MYESSRGKDDCQLQFKDIEGVSMEALEKCFLQLRDLSRNLSKFQPVETSPFRFFGFMDMDVEQQNSISTSIESVQKALYGMQNTIDSFFADVENVTSLIRFSFIKDVDGFLAALKEIKEKHVQADLLTADASQISSAAEAIRNYQTARRAYVEKVGGEWNPAIFSADIPALLREWDSLKGGLFKGKKRKEFVSRISSYSASPINEDEVEERLRKLNSAGICAADLRETLNSVPFEFRKHIDDDPDLILDSLRVCQSYMDATERFLCSVSESEVAEETVQAYALKCFESPSVVDGLRDCIENVVSEWNGFVVANQWTIQELDNKRPDVIIFLNGIPVVLMELKSFMNNNATVTDAYMQIRNYMKSIPSVFSYNAFCIISDMLTTRAGTITADETRFMAWKTITGSEYIDEPGYETLVKGMLEKNRLLDIIKNFILIQKEEKGDIKILAAYHQYHAVLKAAESTVNAIGKTRQGGVFWHTQGSGKSLSMLFLAHLLRNRLSNPTIVVITDRNDLDGQLYSQFAKCEGFLRVRPVQAKDGAELTRLLEKTSYGGIFFTTMQKFEENDHALSLRDDIIVMADEAHRSQYGLGEKLDAETGKLKRGYARLIRDTLPNATFIGFTGTPISVKDHDTTAVFGEVIDTYDMTQAVMDGATRPVYYESRVMNLKLDSAVLNGIDEIVAANSTELEGIDPNLVATQKKMATMESLLNAPDTIQTLCEDIIHHYEGRQDLLTGKAMIVAYSRAVAISIYKKILELRPDWSEKVKVVMTTSNKDPEEWSDIIGHGNYKEELAAKFKDNNDPMKIAIVVDMWLTGFDVPSMATMYVFKPMAGHNLMQAIARVNRVFQDKEGGLVVDYIGIATALKEAMKQFTKRDNDNYGDMDIAKTALVKFRDMLEVCMDMMHGCDHSKFLTGEDADRAKCITDGLNFILGKKEQEQKDYCDAAYRLKQAKSLCSSLIDKDERYHAVYFEAIRMALAKLSATPGGGRGGRVLKELSKTIADLLNHSVQSAGVISLFGDESLEFSLLDEKFLKEVYAMEEKNLASELLKKLLADKIHDFRRTNVVKSKAFSEKMEEILNKWRNMQITNAEVIEQLMALAEEIRKDILEGNELGLSDDEKAFYDVFASSF